jgi:nucleotide-binding universal stress UspA family protein
MRILHPTDFSDCAFNAEEHAVRLARSLDAELLLLHVVVEAPLYGENPFGTVDPVAFYDARRAWATKTLAARAENIRQGTGVTVSSLVCTGAPAVEIVAAARREGVDLVVLGTHGRGRLDRLLVGSVADRVIRTAPCPVMGVKPEAGVPSGARC